MFKALYYKCIETSIVFETVFINPTYLKLLINYSVIRTYSKMFSDEDTIEHNEFRP